MAALRSQSPVLFAIRPAMAVQKPDSRRQGKVARGGTHYSTLNIANGAALCSSLPVEGLGSGKPYGRKNASLLDRFRYALLGLS
jgi:hypothetical protein